MEEELIPPADIREKMTGIEPSQREAIARAQEIYIAVKENPGRVFPLTHIYLETLAKEKKTAPVDIYALSQLMDSYPQIEVDVLADIGIGKVALPMDMVLESLNRKIEQARKLATELNIDLVENGKEAKEKAIGILNKISGKKQDEVDSLVFKSFQRTGAIPVNLMREGADYWWKRVIPNVLTAETLKKIAIEREPRLVEKNATD